MLQIKYNQESIKKINLNRSNIMIEMDTWGEPDTELTFILPGKKSRREIFWNKVKKLLKAIWGLIKKLISYIMSIVGITIIVLIIYAYNNPPEETVIDKMKTELEIQLDQMQVQRVNK